MSYRQSHPIAAFREIVFSLRTSAGAPLTAQTFATADLQLRKPGASSFVNCNAGQQTAVVEIGGGDYVYTFLASELDTVGTGFCFKVNKAGAVQVEYADEIQRAFFATAITGTLGASSFTTDRTETTNDFWKDALIEALSGALVGQVKKIGGYDGTAKKITLAQPQSFTGAPVNGDIFELINR
jgi:hypothetical protein